MTCLPTNSLERALVLLQFIGRTPGGLSNLEISRRYNLARSTCSYILSRLEKEGFLTRNKETGRYRIGLKTVILARGALREAGFGADTEATLYRLANETGLAANLAVLEGNSVIILDRIEGSAFVQAALEESGNRPRSGPPGRGVRSAYLTRRYREVSYELPVHETALGKVLLANLPDQAVTQVEVLSELADIRRQGYCMMQFEPHNESCSLAAPVFDASGAIKGAVSVSCRRHLGIWNDEHALSEMVKEAAWEISCALYYPTLMTTAREGSRPAPNRDNSEIRFRRVRPH
jgi:DNA-binding IclR family transcriptional regulator